LDDLSANGAVDLQSAEDIGTDISYNSNGNGVVFVGRDGQPNLQRYELNDEGQLELTGTLGLDFYGVTDTMGRSQPVVQFIDETHAYYIDLPTLQVIPFDPSATPMTIYADDVFSIDGLEDETYTDINPTLVRRDGNRIAVAARYFDGDDAAPLVKVALIDVTTGDVAYAEDNRCAQVAYAVGDPAGNLYFGSHAALATYNVLDGVNPDAPPPCILRINKDATDFDASYFVDLGAISESGIVGTLLQGADGYAYALEYTGTVPADAPAARAALSAFSWHLRSFKLDDVADTYAAVAGTPANWSYVNSFETKVGTKTVPFLVLSDDNAEGSSAYWNASNPTSPVSALEFPGGAGPALPF
ncbi:MAG TPA: hypothetical protein VLC09_03180, partial [Polyangiaceae bacterium]|nr:hypothetical protein [Polyangiaceae bacterium]